MEAAARQRYLKALGLRDWFAQTQSAPGTSPSLVAREQASVSTPAARRPAGPTIPRPNAAPAAPPAVAEAPQAAPVAVTPRSFDSLDEARSCVAACTDCGLHATRNQTVFGVGPSTAPLMVVGEGPGAEEDKRGEPFVGRAGQLLDAMLAAIGHSRSENCYIANVVKCRPPNNRDPGAEEVAACRPYLDAQITLLKPRLILAVGRVAAQRLLGSNEPLSRLRGKTHHYGEQQVPVWVTYHPAYLLRSPHEKAKAWQDLKLVRAQLDGESGRDLGDDGAGE